MDLVCLVLAPARPAGDRLRGCVSLQHGVWSWPGCCCWWNIQTFLHDSNQQLQDSGSSWLQDDVGVSQRTWTVDLPGTILYTPPAQSSNVTDRYFAEQRMCFLDSVNDHFHLFSECCPSSSDTNTIPHHVRPYARDQVQALPGGQVCHCSTLG